MTYVGSWEQVWKDVDGVLTADPAICPEAQCVPALTFEEAAELAYFGAQVCAICYIRAAGPRRFVLSASILCQTYSWNRLVVCDSTVPVSVETK